MPHLSARIRFARRMARGDAALRLYGILDAESCARRGLQLLEVARAWQQAGVELLQYRDKLADRDTVLAMALCLREVFPPGGSAFLLLNDHPELVAACGFDGAHVGQGDVHPDEARRLLGPDCLLGLSTHTPDQALAAGNEADYIAIGPVYPTATKADAEPATGICGVHAAAAVARAPLVAIGGIGLAEARQVIQAGASSVAVISGLLPDQQGSQALIGRAQDFLAALK